MFLNQFPQMSTFFQKVGMGLAVVFVLIFVDFDLLLSGLLDMFVICTVHMTSYPAPGRKNGATQLNPQYHG